MSKALVFQPGFDLSAKRVLRQQRNRFKDVHDSTIGDPLTSFLFQISMDLVQPIQRPI